MCVCVCVCVLVVVLVRIGSATVFKHCTVSGDYSAVAWSAVLRHSNRLVCYLHLRPPGHPSQLTLLTACTHFPLSQQAA